MVKILGALDILSAMSFLMFVFGIEPFVPFALFCAAGLLIKGMFSIIITNVLGILDLISSILLLLSLIFVLPTVLMWIPAFLLLAKGFISFL